MKKLICIWMLLIGLFYASGLYAESGKIYSDSTGSIYIDSTNGVLSLYSQRPDPYKSSPTYSALSQTVTSLSLFETGINLLWADMTGILTKMTGMSYKEDSEERRSYLYPGNILLFLGCSLALSITGYEFGLKNDILVILPVCPVVVTQGNERGFSFREANRYELHYGLYFYFSKDF